VYLEPFQITSREVTCREYLEFMLDDGYVRPELWLSDGWEAAERDGWEAPLYWERDPGYEMEWRVFTLKGWHELSELLDTPVCHISLFEVDSFARWRGSRLPTIGEWESVAGKGRRHGNLLDTGRLHPARANNAGVEQLFGDCWEWTASPYTWLSGIQISPWRAGRIQRQIYVK
jgi:formylglycine-generating enzyme required for sulfatase activity